MTCVDCVITQKPGGRANAGLGSCLDRIAVLFSWDKHGHLAQRLLEPPRSVVPIELVDGKLNVLTGILPISQLVMTRRGRSSLVTLMVLQLHVALTTVLTA